LGLALTAAPQLILLRARLLVNPCLMRQLYYCSEFGVRRQSVAATVLWIAFDLRESYKIQSGIAAALQRCIHI